MDGPAGRAPADLSPDERARLHRAHQSLRNASQALEALVATEPIRGRWNPAAAPPEALAAARQDLAAAYGRLLTDEEALFGWGPPTVD